MALGPEHAILRGLRERGSEKELTRVLAATLGADPELAAAFVRTILGRSKRPRDSRWQELPQRLECRGEVVLAKGIVDLEFSASGWRVLVELKIDAGYGADQIERYLCSLDAADERQILVSITRDVPKYGDPALEGRRNWAGSLSWRAVFDDLRELRPSNEKLAVQWPLLLDVLEDEGSMGVTKVRPELLRAWADAVTARKHAVAFMENLRVPLLAALQDALKPVLPGLAPEERAGVAPAPSDGRRPRINVDLFVPQRGNRRVSAQLLAWEGLRFVVTTPYPAETKSPEATAAITTLSGAGFAGSRRDWLWRWMPLDDQLLSSPVLVDRLLEWAHESFVLIAKSGILDLEAWDPDGLLIVDSDDEPAP